MSDDGRQDAQPAHGSTKDSTREEAEEPTTEEISRTEIAAIRSSLGDMQLSDDQLAKLESSLGESSDATSPGDEAQKADVKEKLRSRLAQADTTRFEGEANSASLAESSDPFDDAGLDELSDDSLYDAVFGDAADEPLAQRPDDPFEEDTPTVEVTVDDLDESPVPSSKRPTSPGALAAVRGPTSEAEESSQPPADSSKPASAESSSDEASSEPVEPQPDTEGQSATADDDSEPVEDDARAADERVEPSDDDSAPEPTEEERPEPQTPADPAREDGRAPSGSSTHDDPMYDLDPLEVDDTPTFRGAESIILQLVTTAAGLGIMGVCIARLTDDQMFTFLPSTVAGMLSFVGFLLFVGGIVAWFKG